MPKLAQTHVRSFLENTTGNDQTRGETSLEIAFPDESFTDRNSLRTPLYQFAPKVEARSIKRCLRTVATRGVGAAPRGNDRTLPAVEWQEPVASTKASCSKSCGELRSPIPVLIRQCGRLCHDDCQCMTGLPLRLFRNNTGGNSVSEIETVIRVRCRENGAADDISSTSVHG